MGFGNLGLSELLVLAVLVLVFFGPRRIPEVARTVGGALREFRRGWNEIRRELDDLERDDSREDGRRRGSARRGPSRGRVEPGDWDGERDETAPEDAAAREGGAEEARGRRPADGTTPEDAGAEGGESETDAGG